MLEPGEPTARKLRLTHRPGYRWVVLAIGFLGVFGGVGLGRFGYSAILPSMQEGLQFSSASAGALASWNFAGYLAMVAVGGVLARRFGTRLVVGLGSLAAALGMLLTGLANGLATASAARLLTGLGSGMVFVPSVALMSSWFETRRRGVASGVVASGPSLAMVIAGPVVPAIIAVGGADGWRLAWYLFAGLTLAVGLITLLAQRNQPHQGVVSAGGPAAAAPAEAGLEGHAHDGLRHIARTGYAWHVGLVYLWFGFAYMIYLTFFQRRLIGDLGVSSVAAGNLFLMLGIVSLASGFLWGGISDKVGRGRALALNCLLQTIAACLFAWWTTTPGLVISTLLSGLTAVAIPGIIGAGCGDKFGARLASTALGFVTVFMGIGQMLGPYVAGWMADRFGTLENSYLLCAAAYLAASLLALALRDATPHIQASQGGSSELNS